MMHPQSLTHRTSAFIRNLNELIMFKHTIFAMPFIVLALLVGLWKIGTVDTLLIVLALMSAVFARSFAMGFNRYLDRDIDSINPRTQNRPSVDGRFSLPTQRILLGAWAIGFIGCTYYINALAFYLSVPLIGLLMFYSYCKRFTPYAHMVLGICLGLSPIAGDIALSQQVNWWSIWLGLGVAFWVGGFDILYSLQDMDFDKKQRLFSIPSVFGEQKAFYFVRTLHTLTLLAWWGFVYVLDLGILSYVTLGICAIILIYANIVASNKANITRAFFSINGYIGFTMLFGIGSDILRQGLS